MEPINEKAQEKIVTQQSENFSNELIVASILGPVGLFFLFSKKTVNKLQFAGLFCMWFSVVWCRYLTGISFPSTYYEVFILGIMSYGGVVTIPLKLESSVVVALLAALLMLFAAIIGYAELCVVRGIKNFSSPIDLFVIGVGYLGFLLSIYLACKKSPNTP